MREVDLIHRHVELVAVNIGARVQRLHDGLEGLAFFTKRLLSHVTPAREEIARWLEAEGFEVLPTGFFESPARIERVDAAGGRLFGETTCTWCATLRDHEETRRRFYILRDLGPYLARLHAEMPNVAWIYYQDASTHRAAMLSPALRPEALIPHDFDWHEYHSFRIVRPEHNPERAIRWSEPNIDYGGQGLISCVSIPLYQGDELLGVWTMDVRVAGLHAELALERSVGTASRQTNFIADYTGRLIAHPAMDPANAEKGSVHNVVLGSLGGDFASLDIRSLQAQGHGQLELTDASGERLLVAYHTVPNIEWIVFATLPRADMLEATQSAFQRAFAKLGGGDLSFRLDAVADETMQHLVASYNDMTRALEENMRRRDEAEAANRALAVEQERLGRELEIAATIQLSMLPKAPRHPEFEFAGAMRPTHEVGGDFYDVISPRGDHLWLTIGDVSSHGLGSGLVMMIAQAAFQAVFEANPEMAADDVLRHVNRLLHAQATTRLGGGHYVTGQVMVHRGAGVFDCAGAHLWPLVIDPATKVARRIEVVGPWLGVVPDLPRVPVSRLELAPGQVLCLYSDGLLEARNADGEMYGLDRLTVKATELVATSGSLEKCAADLLADVAAFAPQQDDDRTVFLVRRIP